MLDSVFAGCCNPIVLEKLCTACAGLKISISLTRQCLLFSDVPEQSNMRFDEQTSQVNDLQPDIELLQRQHTSEPRGRLVTCEHRGVG